LSILIVEFFLPARGYPYSSRDKNSPRLIAQPAPSSHRDGTAVLLPDKAAQLVDIIFAIRELQKQRIHSIIKFEIML